jgi:hypothetical protein
VTRHGNPPLLLPIDADAFADWVLANTPEHVSDLRAADEDVLHGRTRPVSDVLGEIREDD